MEESADTELLVAYLPSGFRSAAANTESFLPQSDYGVDFGRATGRYVRRNNGCDQQYGYDCSKAYEIDRVGHSSTTGRPQGNCSRASNVCNARPL
jgi:hypothetical protein